MCAHPATCAKGFGTVAAEVKVVATYIRGEPGAVEFALRA